MSRIGSCDYCKIQTKGWATGARQTELYDGIADVQMCWECGNAAKFERERIIKLLEDDSIGYCSCKWEIDESDSGELLERHAFICDPHRYIALIKGEQK